MKFGMTADMTHPPPHPAMTSLLEMSRKMASEHGQAIEAYIRVYLETTGDDIRDLELVTQQETMKSDCAIVQSHSIRRRTVTP